MTALDPLQDLLTYLPVWALLLGFFGSALLEYVIPPYWGDLVMLLAFFWAVQGHVSPPLVFVSCVAGGSLGAAAAYGIGRRYGLTVARRVTRLGRRMPRENGRVPAMLGRFGTPILVGNRFLPVLRGLMLYGAGALRLPFAASMAYTFVSNLAWVGLLWLTAHFSRGLDWSELVLDFRETSRMAAGAAVLLVLSILAIALWRDHRIQNRA